MHMGTRMHTHAHTQKTRKMKEGVRGTTQEEKGIIEVGGEREIVMDECD